MRASILLFTVFSCVKRSQYSDLLWAGSPEIQSLWARDFPHPSRPALWPTQPPVQWVPGLFPGGKAAGPWR